MLKGKQTSVATCKWHRVLPRCCYSSDSMQSCSFFNCDASPNHNGPTPKMITLSDVNIMESLVMSMPQSDASVVKVQCVLGFVRKHDIPPSPIIQVMTLLTLMSSYCNVMVGQKWNDTRVLCMQKCHLPFLII